MSELPRHEDFAPHVDKSFRFPGWGGTLRLAAVELLPGSGMDGGRAVPFNLIFHGPAGDILPEGLYQADVEDGSSLEIYIQPIYTPTRDRQDYQAMFN